MNSTNCISKEDCEVILKSYGGTSNYHVEDFKIVPFRHQLEGFIGEHFTLQINYESEKGGETVGFFLKTLSSNAVMVEIALKICVYEKEEFFYKTLLKQFKKYGIRNSFAPEGYFFKPYSVVLQDLGVLGYKGTPKREPLDLNHCKIGVETIAQFHSTSLLYEKKRTDELGRKFSLYEEYLDILESKIFKNELSSQYFRSSISGMFQLIDLMPEDKVISHEVFKQALEMALEEIMSEDDSKLEFLCVNHGDMWSSNFLYVYDENGNPTEAKLVDYQTLTYGPPQLDLLQFIMTTTRKDFRNNNFQILVEHYHTTLSELLIKGGCNEVLPSKSEFVESCEAFKLPAKVLATVDRATTLISNEIYANVLKSEEIFRKFLFEERGKYILDSFNSDSLYKNVLLEDVLELRDLLFATKS